MFKARKYYSDILNEIKESGLWKEERIITTPQRSLISTTKARGVLNMCANNYLGLADNEEVIEEELYELIKSNIVYSIMAYQINVNGEKIGIVNSEYEAKSIIEEVKNYFTKDYDKETLLEVTTVEDIEIKQVKATNAEIMTITPNRIKTKAKTPTQKYEL
jgi:hypothetical protein